MESVEKFCERNPHTVSSAFITALQLDIQRAGVHAQLASLKETT